MNDFAGRVAVVTGGASGIGAACTALFTSRGATVAVVDLPDGDVTQPLEKVFEQIAAEHGGVDILVNSAGISAVGPVEANSDEEWHRVLDVNVVGIVRASRAALPYLKKSPHGGVIVNMSSIVATAGLVNRALYSASKGAVHALTLAMAADLVADGVRVCCVAPGTV
ncbi:MAG: SDR family NAD(P)-dependent oxidoreductase, partial [Hamadaea sp.]|nr:SDR family NAD(P)-dependent oxidoreductase [Hamadaea sp.]